MEEQPSYSGSAALRTIASLLIYILIYYALFRDLRSILFLVLVIVVHEGGHFLAMKKFGYRDMKMFFIPFFGAFVSGQSGTASPYQRAIMIMAGPIPGILIGLLLFAISTIFELETLRLPALLFMALNAINLFPVSPLDGGQLLQIIFPAANRIMQTIFTILLIIVITWISFRLRNFLLLMMDVFLFYRLSILFGDRKTGDSHDLKNLDEISEGKKVLLLSTWLLAMILTVLILGLYWNRSL